MRNNKKIGILVILALLGVSNTAFAQDTVDFGLAQDVSFEKIKANKDTLSKAQEAIDNKDYSTAVTLLTAYINEKPKKYEIYKLRGDAYYALRRYDLAQKDYQSAIDIKAGEDKFMTNTKYVSAIVLGADKKEQLQNAELGDLYGALMYAQKAQNDQNYLLSYENAVKYNSHIYLPQPNKRDINRINCPQKYGKVLNPQGIDAKIYGAVDDIEKGNYNEALYKLQSVTAQYPNYYLGHYLTGVALAELEKDSEAIQSFDKAITLNPYDFESYASLGQIYYSKAETTFSDADAKKSIEYFNKALQLNKNCPTYYFYIGMNELQMGNTSVAVANFDKALKINSEDYNSAYYKLIAQYMKGDYQDVIDGTSRLIQKHVSNYNSVLYLRALAYTQLNDCDNALEDLNTIENNIGDIYNNDIKKVSDREKSLEGYIHYLKAQIQHLKGAGAAEDTSKANVNPIINRLANAKKSIEPYEKSLQGENISLDDYKKFESFYSTSLPKLLESGAVITYDDIDNQYDYIRTTFDDLGISFLYMNPDYKITTIKDYPYKKYGVKLNVSPKTIETEGVYDAMDVENVELAKAQKEALKKFTPSSALLAQEGQVSIAQMLAFNELGQSSEKPVTDTEKQNQQFQPEIPAAENTDSSKNIASGENREMQTPLVNPDNTQKVQDILKEEESINNAPAIRGSSEPAPAENVDSGNVKISSVNNTKNEIQNDVLTNNTQKAASELSEQSEPAIIAAQETKQTKDIVSSADVAANSAAEAANVAVGTVNTSSAEIENQKENAEISSQETEKPSTEKFQEENKPAEQTAKQVQEETKKQLRENSSTVVKNSASAAAISGQSARKTVKVKHANLNANNHEQIINANDMSDVVELKTSDTNKKISNESDLFNEKTVFTKPGVNNENLTPAVTLPEEPLEVSKPVSVKKEEIIVIEEKTEPEQELVINTLEITVPETIQENNFEKSAQQISDSLMEQSAEILVASDDTDKEEYAKQKLSQVLDEMVPKQTSQTEQINSQPAEGDIALQQTMDEIETIKSNKQKLKEEAKQIKEEKKAEALKLKEEAKLQKQQAKDEALKAKAEANAEKQRIKQKLKQAKEEEKLAKIKEKQTRELEKIQAKTEQQKEEIKINQLKSKLAKEKNSAQDVQNESQKTKLTLKQKIQSKFSKKNTETKSTQGAKHVIKQTGQKSEQLQNEDNSKEKFSFKQMCSKMKFWKKNK